MKKNIGSTLALYPTPAVVVGTEVNGKVNWLLVAHVGIIGHDQIMLSLFKKHYTNEGIKQTGKVSVNMVNEAMLERADYVGCVSGVKEDKMAYIVELIDRVLQDPENEDNIAAVRKDVNAMMSGYPLFAW